MDRAKINALFHEYLAEIGSRGGKATGDRKKRSPEQYKAMAAKSAQVRKERATSSASAARKEK